MKPAAVALVALVALAAVVAVNLVLLGYGSDRSSPAGKLGPYAKLPALPSPAPATTTVPAPRHHAEHDD